MPDSSAAPSPDAPSALIAQRFECEVDPMLAEFWDSGQWKQSGEGEFRTAIDPHSLLAEHPESIWPGLMPCHQLPVIENDRGDCLAVRLNAKNQLKEMVHWFHGGGDWIPWGDDIGQALVFNRLASRLPGFDHRHCVDAEPIREPADDQPTPWFDWAIPKVKPFDAKETDSIRLAESLLSAGISVPAVLAGLIASHFDHYRIEPWIALAVQTNPNLAWGWEAAGRRSEKTGRVDEAIDFYGRGARCSVFTSQSVRMQTHADEESTTKYSASRLQALAPEELQDDAYFSALTSPTDIPTDTDATSKSRHEAIGEYWTSLAGELEDGSPEQMFSLHMSGWDVGRTAMDQYADVIERIIGCAQTGNMTGRAAIARVHLNTLRHRYG